MQDEVKIAFEKQVVILSLNEILPSKMLPVAVKESAKYRRIAASVAQLGLVEPLVVSRAKGSGPYLLLDGHVRFSALRDQGSTNARCLIASDDEGFTYNKRVNRLATIQEHYMIVRALNRGVSEEKLARALDVDVGVIRRRRDLLNGISADVAELLKDKPVGTHTFGRPWRARYCRRSPHQQHFNAPLANRHPVVIRRAARLWLPSARSEFGPPP